MLDGRSAKEGMRRDRKVRVRRRMVKEGNFYERWRVEDPRVGKEQDKKAFGVLKGRRRQGEYIQNWQNMGKP